jgi:hypothetical protein
MFFLTIAGGSTPLLRHDWGGYPFSPENQQPWYQGLSGWSPVGLGFADPYLINYMPTLICHIMTLCLGQTIAYNSFIALLGFSLCWNAFATAKLFDSSNWLACGAAAFVCCNPWVYTQVVAGHMFMVLSYCGIITLVNSTIAPIPSRYLWLAIIALYAQFQFAVICLPLLMWLCIKSKAKVAGCTMVLLLAPAILGIALNAKTIAAIPYIVAWQRVQSLSPPLAMTFRGYFAGYASQGFDGFLGIILWLFPIFALVGLARTILVRSPLVIGAAIVLTLLTFSMGVLGPSPTAYAWLVSSFPQTGLFRELYDLIGVYVIACLVFGIIGVSYFSGLDRIWFFSAILLLFGWMMQPPAKFWVTKGQLPQAAVSSIANSRYALMPPLFPLSFFGRGSGIDPDWSPRPNNVTPINQGLSTYPVSAALGSYVISGDRRELAALGVSKIIQRPWLSVDGAALSGILPLPVRLSKLEVINDQPIEIQAQPELSIGPLPSVGSVLANFGAFNVLLSDAPARDSFHGEIPSGSFIKPLPVPNAVVKASAGWASAQLAFFQMPRIAQPFGGAITTSSRSDLHIQPGLDTLVWVEGRLAFLDAERRESAEVTDTRGYKWIRVGPTINEARCFGFCVIAAQGIVPRNMAMNPLAKKGEALDFKSFAPWLLISHLNSSPSISTIRSLSTFDSQWIALADWNALSHVRLDGEFNGWTVPAHVDRKTLVILNQCAVIQSFFELLGVLWILITTGIVVKHEFIAISSSRRFRGK